MIQSNTRLGLLAFTRSVVCLLPQVYSNKFYDAIEVLRFISLWCLAAQRKGMVIIMKITRRNCCFAALFVALCAICSQIQIPLPVIPINLALFAVLLAGALLGARLGGLAMLAYVLLGALGAPVFTGLQGGVGVLFGKTGGYLVGYIAAAVCTGWLATRWGKRFFGLCGAMAVGVAACYLTGTAWYMLLTRAPLWVSLCGCVFPFLPGDAVKLLLAASITRRLQPRMRNSGK